jgi:hypothetical protein
VSTYDYEQKIIESTLSVPVVCFVLVCFSVLQKMTSDPTEGHVFSLLIERTVRPQSLCVLDFRAIQLQGLTIAGFSALYVSVFGSVSERDEQGKLSPVHHCREDNS